MYIRRKVFSLGEDDSLMSMIEERAFTEGYVQRMFDEAENNKPTYYDKEQYKKDRRSLMAKEVVGLGGALGASLLAGHLLKKSVEKEALNPEMVDKLTKYAKDRNIDIQQTLTGNVGESIGDKNVKQALDKSTAEKVIQQLEGNAGVVRHSASVHGKVGATPHELGHLAYTSSTGKGGKLGTAFHYVKAKQRRIDNLLGARSTGISATKGLGLAAAFTSGANAGMKEQRGEKEGVVSKIAGIGTPILMEAPSLGAEAAASIKGHKILKELGANAETLSNYRRAMIPAFGTYLAGAGLNIVAAMGARQLGKFVGKKMESDKQMKEQAQQNQPGVNRVG